MGNILQNIAALTEGITSGVKEEKLRGEQRELIDRDRQDKFALQKRKEKFAKNQFMVQSVSALSDLANQAGLTLRPDQFSLFRENLEQSLNQSLTGGAEFTPRPEDPRLQIERDKLKIAGEKKQEDKSFTKEGKLRSEFVKSSDNFIKQRDAFGQIKASAQDPSAAGDIALIFSFMKMLDPTSVVREGEQATAANARGVPEAIRTQYNRIISGERLGENQRADFVKRSNILFTDLSKQHDKRKKTFTGLARRAGLSSENVVIDLGFAEERGTQRQPSSNLAPDIGAHLKNLGF